MNKKPLPKDRCDHCGEWVKAGKLYTLENIDSNLGGAICVCQKCSRTFNADYWQEWLFKRVQREAK